MPKVSLKIDQQKEEMCSTTGGMNRGGQSDGSYSTLEPSRSLKQPNRKPAATNRGGCYAHKLGGDIHAHKLEGATLLTTGA